MQQFLGDFNNQLETPNNTPILCSYIIPKKAWKPKPTNHSNFFTSCTQKETQYNSILPHSKPILEIEIFRSLIS